MEEDYKLQRYLHILTADRIVFLQQKTFLPGSLPWKLELFKDSVFGFWIEKKIKAWKKRQQEMYPDKWYKVSFDKTAQNVSYSGPYLSKEEAIDGTMPTIIELPLQMVQLKQDTYPWTPFSDMIDGPEDYCALSLDLVINESNQADLEGTFNLLDGMTQEGPQYFGNSVHKEDPEALRRVKIARQLLSIVNEDEPVN